MVQKPEIQSAIIYYAIWNGNRRAIISTVVVDCIFIRMISVALVRQNLQNEKQLHPLSVQDFDEIALVTSGDMISIAETIMTEANVEVQKFKNSEVSKCAVLYDRSCNKELHTSNLCAIFLKTFLKWAKKIKSEQMFS